jgi:iron complex outermembrane receptor protein
MGRSDIILGRASLAALALGLAPLAHAAEAADGAAQLGEVIVTGTRSTGETAATASFPVSVYDSSRLERAGYPDLGRALAAISPSVNMPHSQTSPSAANTRSITMKGLAPDQVLVLVNGKRWQPSAVLVFNNAVGRGSAPFDLGAIPMSAVERIEVLDDGAAAQYGSDAIAGVVNIILKSNAEGGLYGGQLGVTGEGDGFAYDVSGSQGFRLGPDGHLTLSGDLRHQNPTNRSPVDPRTGRIDQRTGDPRALDIGFAADAGYAVRSWVDLYGSLVVSHRDSTSAPTFRLPSVSVLYPQGFLPQVNPTIWSVTAIAGVRGTLSDFRYDVSNSLGFNKAQFDVHDTANAALKAASPTSFNSGALRYLQDTANLTVSHALPQGLVPGDVAAGVEYRFENYGIIQGEPLSYQRGGAQGFPGFAPRLPVDASRHAESAFVDLTLRPLARIKLSGAGRYDHYSDFGGAATWKVGGRWDLTDWLAVRGSVGTGFRAPSLQQQYFSSVISQITPTGALTRTGTYQVRDPIAQALGATPLKPEKSDNYTVGLVLQPLPRLRLTADWYSIKIRDRIILSDTLSGPAVTAVLKGQGITDVQQVQFFTNAADTRTEGYELAASYLWPIDDDDALTADLQYGQYRTRLQRLAANPVLPTLPLLGTISKGLLISAQPIDKLTSDLTFTRGDVAATLSVNHYGSWTSAPLGTIQTFSGKTLVDLSAKVALTPRVSITAGVLNLGDVYPDVVIGAAAIGLIYGDEAPFGVNGRSYFVRLQVTS